jgi:hypothetical protein
MPNAEEPDAMTNDKQIREKLAKIKTLFAGATTNGERQAAQAAIERLQQRIDGVPTTGPIADPPVEFRFSLTNPWSLRLFLALCRSKGYRPYRHPRMRRTSVCLMIGKRAVNADLWPEYLEMNKVLTEYLGELADHIISDCINPDRSDAEVVAGLPGPAAGGEMEG